VRCCDEARCCATAVRLIEHGGPLYQNALDNYGPALYWFTATVFRVAGNYHMPAVRVAEMLWWAATALVLYATARTMLGRGASLAAAGAFLLTALNPYFQDIRGEPLASLPLAAAVGLCIRGIARRQAWCLALAGAASAAALLTKQQAGLALPVLAAVPLVAWAWRRRERKLWLAAVGSALVVAGFAATVGVVWLSYAVRGAGHAFFYGLWAHNWASLHLAPAGGYLASVTFLVERVARYSLNEPLVPLAVVGALVGLAWRGPEEGRTEPVAWRAWVASLTALLGAMWLAASPAGIPAKPLFAYVHYQSLLYVPLCLLVGVCVEAALRLRSEHRSLAAALLAVGVAYVLIPAIRQADTPIFRLRLYPTVVEGWRIAATGAAVVLAGWLLGGRRLLWLAPLLWAVVYLSGPEALGFEGGHLGGAACLAAVGVLWQARQQRSLSLAGLGGVVHAAATWLGSSPQWGLALGAAAWLLVEGSLSRKERWAFAAAYLAPVTILSAMLMSGEARQASGLRLWWWNPDTWNGLGIQWLMAWRLTGTVAVCGVLLLARNAGGPRAAWDKVSGSAIALLLLAAIGALAAAPAVHFGSTYLAAVGTATVLAAALSVSLLIGKAGPPSPARAAALLTAACLVAGAVALGRGFRAPRAAPFGETHQRLVKAMEPGSPLYVWGSQFETELYLRARAAPAAPQIYTRMVEGVGPPPVGGFPHVASLEGLDESLSDSPPPCLVIFPGPGIDLAALPRFGPILRTRYRVVGRLPKATLYRLTTPSAP